MEPPEASDHSVETIADLLGATVHPFHGPPSADYDEGQPVTCVAKPAQPAQSAIASQQDGRPIGAAVSKASSDGQALHLHVVRAGQPYCPNQAHLTAPPGEAQRPRHQQQGQGSCGDSIFDSCMGLADFLAHAGQGSGSGGVGRCCRSPQFDTLLLPALVTAPDPTVGLEPLSIQPLRLAGPSFAPGLLGAARAFLERASGGQLPRPGLATPLGQPSGEGPHHHSLVRLPRLPHFAAIDAVCGAAAGGRVAGGAGSSGAGEAILEVGAEIRAGGSAGGSTGPSAAQNSPLPAPQQQQQQEDGARGWLAVLGPAPPYRLGDVLRFSPAALEDEGTVLLLLYQLLCALRDLHAVGGSLVGGGLLADAIGVSDTLWLTLSARSLAQVCPAPPQPGLDLMTHAWQVGRLSNYDYLLAVNRAAGRRWGDATFHPILPWVLDMSQPPETATQGCGLRDLTRTKYRLAKGDEQLSLTYAMSDEPHHVSDTELTDVAYCIYMARRLPVPVLVRVVRSSFEPNEYPGSISRLYLTSPDECIPEFYSDPSVFYSLHPGMADLGVPDWASSPEDFVRRHRQALESDAVTGSLHHWIDVTFGYKLSGQAAVEAKNVSLPPRHPSSLRATGRYQVFDQPHPWRQGTAAEAEAQGSAAGAAAALQQLERSLCAPLGECATSPAPAATQQGGADEGWWGGDASAAGGGGSSGGGMPAPSPPVGRAVGFTPPQQQQQQGGCMVVGEATGGGTGQAARWGDVEAFGRLAVQLYQRRVLAGGTGDSRFWEAQAASLLHTRAEPMVAACIGQQPGVCRRPEPEQLLGCDLFDPAVRAAYDFMLDLHTLGGSTQASAMEAAVASSSSSSTGGGHDGGKWHGAAVRHLVSDAGERAWVELLAQDGALALVLPPLLQVLKGAAEATCADSGLVQPFGRVLGRLVQQLTPQQAEQLLTPEYASWVSGAAPCHAALRVLLLGWDLLSSLARRLPLDSYLRRLHPVVVAAARRPTAPAFEKASGRGPAGVEGGAEEGQVSAAARDALCRCAALWPLPQSLRHVVAPALACLGEAPEAALLLAGLAGALGGQLAAEHLVPALVRAVAAAAAAAGPAASPPPQQQGLVGIAAAAAAAAAGEPPCAHMAALNAITVLEASLPLLEQGDIESRILGARLPAPAPTPPAAAAAAGAGVGSAASSGAAIGSSKEPRASAEIDQDQIVDRSSGSPGVVSPSPSLPLLSAAGGGGGAAGGREGGGAGGAAAWPALLLPVVAPESYPYLPPHLRGRVVGLLVQAARVAGGAPAFQSHMMPAAARLFNTPFKDRHKYGTKYGSSAPAQYHRHHHQQQQAGIGDGGSPPTESGASGGTSASNGGPPTAMSGASATATRYDGDGGAGGTAAGGSAAATAGYGGDGGGGGTAAAAAAMLEDVDDIGYWDLVHSLYPEAQEAVGPAAVRAAVPGWPLLERTLQARFGWDPPAVPRATVPGHTQNGGGPGQGSQQLLASLRNRMHAMRGSGAWLATGPLPQGSGGGGGITAGSRAAQGSGGGAGGGGAGSRAAQPVTAAVQRGPPSAHGSATGSPVPPSPLQELPDSSSLAAESPFMILSPTPTGLSTSAAAGSGGGGSEGRRVSQFTHEYRSSELQGGPWDASASGGGGGGLEYRRGWRWLPPDNSLWDGVMGASWPAPPPPSTTGCFWQQPWRLRARIVHSWRAHTDRCRALVASHQDEGLIVTAGGRGGARGGGDGDVVRCWRLADVETDVQYTEHACAVLCMCMVEGGPRPLVASCDSSGAVHVWPATTAATGALSASVFHPSPSSSSLAAYASSGGGAGSGGAGSRALLPGLLDGGGGGGGAGGGEYAFGEAGALSGEVDMLNGAAWVGDPLGETTSGATAAAAAAAGGAVAGGSVHQAARGVGAGTPPPAAAAAIGAATIGAAGGSSAAGFGGGAGASGGGGSGGGVVRVSDCYSAVCSLGLQRPGTVAAATVGGRVRLLDAAAGRISADFATPPIGSGAGAQQQAGSSWSSCMALGGDGSCPWLALGSSSGAVSVIDMRCGMAMWSWRPHEAALTALASHDQHVLMSASQDGCLKLWDLRMALSDRHAPPSSVSSAHPASPSTPSMCGGMPICTHTLRPDKGVGIGGLAKCGADVVVHLGSRVAALSMQQLGGHRLASVKLADGRGVRCSGRVVGLALLPHSRLMVVGTEDGHVRVCV